MFEIRRVKFEEKVWKHGMRMRVMDQSGWRIKTCRIFIEEIISILRFNLNEKREMGINSEADECYTPMS